MTVSLDDVEKMHKYVAGRLEAQAVYVAAKFGLSDLLQEKAMSIPEMAQRAQLNEKALGRLMRALAGMGVYQDEGDGIFSLTSMGATLCTDVPHSLRDITIFCGAPWHWDLSRGLDYCIETGKPYAPEYFGEEFFPYINKNKAVASQFHSAMTSLSSVSNLSVAENLDLSGSSVVADIGGGEGGLLRAVLNKWSHVTGKLFDISSAIENAKEHFEKAGLSDRAELVSGDFFESVPVQADTYLIKHVMHGLGHDECVKLLQNVKKSAGDHARLVIVEMVMPGPNEYSYSKLNDLEMMLFSSRGCERSLADFEAILSEAGFEYHGSRSIQMGLKLIEAVCEKETVQ